MGHSRTANEAPQRCDPVRARSAPGHLRKRPTVPGGETAQSEPSRRSDARKDERRAHETPTTNSTRPDLCMSWPVARTRIQHSCARSRRESTEAAPRTPPEDELAITDRAVKSLGSAARTAVRRAVNAPASRTRMLRWASSTIERPTRFGSDADARGTSETRRQTRRRREIARCPFAGASWQRRQRLGGAVKNESNQSTPTSTRPSRGAASKTNLSVSSLRVRSRAVRQSARRLRMKPSVISAMDGRPSHAPRARHFALSRANG